MRTRSVTLENLSLGTSYQVQVRAVSDVGSGPFSDMRTLYTYRGTVYTYVCYLYAILCSQHTITFCICTVILLHDGLNLWLRVCT